MEVNLFHATKLDEVILPCLSARAYVDLMVVSFDVFLFDLDCMEFFWSTR